MSTNYKIPPEASICGCVVKWLLKHKSKEVEYDSKGQLYWREGFSPRDRRKQNANVSSSNEHSQQ